MERKLTKKITIGTVIITFFCTHSFAAIFNVSNTQQFRQALEGATMNGQDDTIILEAGVYKTTDDALGTFQFYDDEYHDLTIKAQDSLDSSDVILDGNNSDRVLQLNSKGDSKFTLMRLSIINGSDGGFSTGGRLVVEDCNIADNWGGGIRVSSYHSGDYTLSIDNSTISNNSGGSGVFLDPIGIAYFAGSVMTISNSTISNNEKTYNNGGGGIAVWGNSILGSDNLIIINSVISNNSAPLGGGVWNPSWSPVNLVIINSTISNNRDNKGDEHGGGIYGHGVFINNIFSENSSDIYFTGSSKVYNNYIDYTKLLNEGGVVKKDNIQPSEGDLDFIDVDFRIGGSSIAIDKGLDPYSGTFKDLIVSNTLFGIVSEKLITDMDGNHRIAGTSIDLGAYEYGSTTCSYDPDNDGICGNKDNCPFVSNITQTDSDNDHIGNLCDNCLYIPNPKQTDVSSNGIGDACDPGDFDKDGISDMDEFLCGSNPSDPNSKCSEGLPWLMLLLREEV